MKEYTYTIDEHLKNGLREREEVPRNSPFLDTAINIKAHKTYGLIPYSEVSMPTLSDITVDFPFPQLFIGKNTVLLADSDTVYTTDTSTWDLTEITTYDPYNESSEKSITAGDQWHFMDFGDSWFLFNGSCTVFKTAKDSIFGDTDKVFVLDTMTINSGCYLNGRAIMGGFAQGDFWHSDYETYWQGVLDDINESPSVNLSMPIKQNFVSWSSIGGGDVLFWILPDLAKTGLLSSEYSSSKALLLDYLKRNELGFMPMPWSGAVKVVKPLGNGFMVYGDNGISYMKQYREPVPTFGLTDIANFGIMGRGAVGGNRSRHLFIDEDGYLWAISSKLKMDKLDYSYLLSGLTNPTVTFNNKLMEFYISDSSNQYIMSSGGLTEGNQYICSFEDGDAIYKSSGVSSAKVITEPIDFGIRSIKQIMALEFGITGSATFTARVHYKYDKNDSFDNTSYKTLNKEGVVYPLAGGNEFKIEVKADKHSNLDKLDYINIRYKVLDKRSVRGRYRVK